MPSQHTTEEAARGAGIFVPVGLSEWHVLKQEWQANGTIRAEVIATTPQAIGPHCQKTWVKIHATRARKQRDVAPRDQHVELILYKRRLPLLVVQETFYRARYRLWKETQDDEMLPRDEWQASLDPARSACGQNVWGESSCGAPLL